MVKVMVMVVVVVVMVMVIPKGAYKSGALKLGLCRVALLALYVGAELRWRYRCLHIIFVCRRM